MKFLINEKALSACSQFGIALIFAFATGTATASPEADYKAGVKSHRAGDLVGAMTPLKRSADAGHAPAQALYGSILDSAELNAEAVIYLRKAVEQGDPDGMYYLARMYGTGDATPPHPGEATRLLQAAADKGHEPAIIVLASSYLRGAGPIVNLDADDVEVIARLTQAANIGHKASIEALFNAYQTGARFGVAANPDQAEYWSKRLKQLQEQSVKTGDKK